MRYLEIIREAREIIAYHATYGPLRDGRFEAFTHFGSLKAAQDRLRDVAELPDTALGFTSGTQHGDPRIYRVRLAITKPLMIEDGWQDHDDQVRGLLRLGHITQQEADYLLSDEAMMNHVDPEDLLKRRGYDGYVYRNVHEDPGSLSYVPWYREQITVVGTQSIGSVD